MEKSNKKFWFSLAIVLLSIFLSFSVVYSGPGDGDSGGSGGEGDGGGSGGEGDGGGSGGEGDGGGSGGEGDGGDPGNGPSGVDSGPFDSGSGGDDSPSNTPPVITSTPITTATEDIQYTYAVSFSDAEGDASLSLSQAPINMSLSGNTLVWIPSDIQANQSHSVTVTVSDGEFSDSQTFTIFVTRVNDAPVFSTIPTQTIQEDSGFFGGLVNLFNFVFDEETSLIDLIFGFDESNPEIVDCSLNNNNIDCQTQQNRFGNSTVTVTATDEENLTSSTSFVVEVQNVDDAPIISIPGVIGGEFDTQTENIPFDIVISVDEVDGQDTTFTVDFGDGNVVSGEVIGGVINLEHEYLSPGTFTVVVTITDGTLTTTETFTVEVLPFEVAIIADQTSISRGDTVTFDATTFGGAEPFRFSWDFDNDGNIDIIDEQFVRNQFNRDGTFIVKAIVRDADGDVSEAFVVITVLDDKVLVRNTLRVNDITFLNPTVQPGQIVEAFVDVENVGLQFVDNVQVRVTVPRLGVKSRATVSPIEVGEKISKIYMVPIPAQTANGDYAVQILVDVDGDRTVLYRQLTVKR